MPKPDIVKQINQTHDPVEKQDVHTLVLLIYLCGKPEKWEFIVGRDKENEQVLI